MMGKKMFEHSVRKIGCLFCPQIVGKPRFGTVGTDNYMRFTMLLTTTFLLVASPIHAQKSLQLSDVTCEGAYAGHLQGVCVDDGSIYWSYTTTLVKTDLNGELIKKIPVVTHHGDLCIDDGKLYVAVNLGKFNDPNGNADSWIYVYDADSLQETARHEVQQVFHGAGGIGIQDGRFFVVGGLPGDIQENYVYEYDDEFRFLKRHSIKSGQTRLGIQSATFAHDRWWFGCYGTPKILVVTDPDFQMKGRYEFDCSLGIVGLSDGRLLSATGKYEKDTGHSGRIRLVVPDATKGLRDLNEN